MPQMESVSGGYVARSRPVEERPKQPVEPAEKLEHKAPFRWTQRGREELPVRVSGELPTWLRGELVRTGPALFAYGSFRAAHWFDGLALLYAFRIGEGVRFKQRLLASRALEDASAPRRELATFATATERSLWSRIVRPVPPITDNANVNVVPWQGAWLAMTESPHQHIIDGDSLASAGPYYYEDEFAEDLPMTAHPHFDFAQRALVNVGTRFGARPELVVYRQHADSHARVVEGRLPLSRLPYVHSFGLTPRYALIIDHPWLLNPMRTLFSNRGIADHYRYQPERGTRLWKLDRASGTFTAYETDALFCFHTVNAFEDGEDVVLDFVDYDDTRIVSALRVDALVERLPELHPRFVRARLSPRDKHARIETLSPAEFDLPNIDYRVHAGRAYRTVWGAELGNLNHPSGPESSLVKVDLARAELRRFSEPGMTYGEPVFVPNPAAAQSDEGVVLSVGSHAVEERSTLAVLDAQTMEPLARCEVPLNLPLGFHGNFKLATRS